MISAAMEDNLALSQLDDAQLVRYCLTKRQDAFNSLMQRYLKPVYSYIYGYVQQHELAEDLTQETFMRVYRALNTFDQTRAFKPWLFTIATNVCKSTLKKAQTGPILLDDDSQNLFDKIPVNDARELEIPDTALDETLAGALSELSPSVRQALVLRHVYDMSYEEVAEALSANLNTVRTWLKRGRETLQQKLTPEGGLR